MKKDNVIAYANPAKLIVEDSLTIFLREQAQQMLQVAIEAEVAEFLSAHANQRLANGHQRVVRNGHLPKRKIQTGIGDVAVKMPRVRDRSNESESIRFHSNLIPNYMRRTATLDVLLPLMYLKGISTGDFQSTLAPLLGSDAKNLSPNVISRLKASWHDDYLAWQKRDLSQKRYLYWWVDGVYLKARMESEKTCMLVIVGADESGKKELVAMVDGFRESKESWLGLLQNLQQRGLTQAPRVAVGDGALGFWGALTEVFPATQHQRCWMHKMANVLDKLPKSQREKAKSMLQDIYMAATEREARGAWNDFIEEYQLKYTKAVDCLLKDKNQLFTFYHYPAEHWVHLRTTNPIESTFSTVRHRTKKSRNCCSRTTIIASVFKLMQEAEKRWRLLNGKQRIAQVIKFEKFIDGVHESELDNQQQDAA